MPANLTVAGGKQASGSQTTGYSKARTHQTPSGCLQCWSDPLCCVLKCAGRPSSSSSGQQRSTSAARERPHTAVWRPSSGRKVGAAASSFGIPDYVPDPVREAKVRSSLYFAAELTHSGSLANAQWVCERRGGLHTQQALLHLQVRSLKCCLDRTYFAPTYLCIYQHAACLSLLWLCVCVQYHAKEHAAVKPFRPASGAKARLSMRDVNPYVVDARPAPSIDFTIT